MAVSYKRLWKLLIDKDISKTELCRRANITTNVVANMGKCQSVKVESLARICEALDCRIEDIMEIVPDANNITREAKG